MTESPMERLSALAPEDREAWFLRQAEERGMTVAALKASLVNNWRFQGRPKQHPPPGDWMFWFLNSGRGFGKTLSAAQWTKRRGLRERCRIALVAPTLGDVRATMIEGETGLLSILPSQALLGGSRASGYNRTNLELRLANGTIMQAFSAEEPTRLRGPQHHYAWCEEVSSWKDANRPPDDIDTTWSNLTLGLRLGSHPQAVITSTPKPNKLTKMLIGAAASGDGTTVMVKGSSYENRANLSDAYWRAVIAPLEGKRAGRQEIHAELLEDVEGALWTRLQIDLLRVPAPPPLARIVVGVDPNVSSSASADAAGIVVAGIEARRDWPNAYVLADRTVERGGPRAWAQAAVDAYHEFEADRIIAEVNNGGEMVELTLKNIDPSVAYKAVRASRGKRVRAEPISALYEGIEGSDDRAGMPKVHHVGLAADLADLEDEMTTWVPADESPNRMDALVWALTELMLGPKPGSGRTSVPKGRIAGVDARTSPGATTTVTRR